MLDEYGFQITNSTSNTTESSGCSITCKSCEESVDSNNNVTYACKDANKAYKTLILILSILGSVMVVVLFLILMRFLSERIQKRILIKKSQKLETEKYNKSKNDINIKDNKSSKDNNDERKSNKKETQNFVLRSKSLRNIEKKISNKIRIPNDQNINLDSHIKMKIQEKKEKKKKDENENSNNNFISDINQEVIEINNPDNSGHKKKDKKGKNKSNKKVQNHRNDLENLQIMPHRYNDHTIKFNINSQNNLNSNENKNLNVIKDTGFKSQVDVDGVPQENPKCSEKKKRHHHHHHHKGHHHEDGVIKNNSNIDSGEIVNNAIVDSKRKTKKKK